MSLIAPKGRQHLSADALFRLVRSGFDSIPDHRGADAEIAFTDALMSACTMFALHSPSLLAFDKQRAEGHVGRIYGMERVPCDTQRRAILDPVAPASLRPLFKRVLRQLQRGKALEPMAFLDGHSLLALDGAGSFASTTIHCSSCLHKVHRNGSMTYYHQMLGVARIQPDVRAVMPLMPEPIVQQDGTEQNDCERKAAKRCMAKLRKDHPHLKCSVTEESVSATAPHLETLQDHHLHSILGVKEGDHAYVCAQAPAAEHAGRVTYDERHDRAMGVMQRLRLVNDVPLNASTAAVRVNCIAYWARGADKIQHCSGVTDLRVSQRNVYHLMRDGLARWKIANETLNTLQNQGDTFEHHDGHGERNLSVVLATMMMLAFLVDQVQQLCCAVFRAVGATLGSTRLV